MKKLLLLLLFVTTTAVFAQQLTWRFSNPQVISCGSQLQFDIDVKADVGGTYALALTTVSFDYNGLGFGLNIWPGSVSFERGTLLLEQFPSGSYKNAVQGPGNTLPQTFSISTQSTYPTFDPTLFPDFFTFVPDIFTQMYIITIDIVDPSQVAGVVFNETFMNGSQFYQGPGTSIPFSSPGFYDSDLLISFPLGGSTPGWWIEEGLVAWYPFNGNANDESGIGNDGIVAGATITNDRFEIPSSAFSFDGSNDYIDCGDVDEVEGLDLITISGWIKPNTFESYISSIIVKEDVWFLQIENSILSFTFQGQSVGIEYTLPSANTWYHIVCVSDGAITKLYINGLLVSSVNAVTIPTSNYSLSIGARNWNGTQWQEYFNGEIDDIRILNCALDVEQIWQLYTMDGILMNLPDTLMACYEENIELDAGPAFSSYLWSTGETTQIINVTETGTYSVTVEDDLGSIAKDSTYVNVLNAHIAQNDTTLILGETVELSLAGNGKAIISDGLFAWYSFNNSSIDVTGNGHDLTNYGGIYTEDRFGNPESSVSFYGLNDEMERQWNDFPLDSFTISLWCRFEGQFQYSAWSLFEYGETHTGNTGGQGITIGSDENWYWRNCSSYGNGYTIYAYVSNGGVNIDPCMSWDEVSVWNHLLVTGYMGEAELYYNGNYIGNCPYSYPIPTNNNYSWIGNIDNNSSLTTRHIDDIRIYNRKLKTTEISTLYGEGNENYSFLWSTGDTTSSIQVTPLVNTTYYVEISDGVSWCTDSITVSIEHQIQMDLKVFLEGPYFNNGMTPFLNAFDVIPLDQPYNPPLPYYNNNSPKWLYNGVEQLSEIPEELVDWVVVQLRDAPSAAEATTGTIVDEKAGLLMTDGSIREMDGITNLSLYCVPENNLYVVVYHRNHLAIMSNYALTETGGLYSYDFTNGVDKVYGGINGHKELENNIWGMVAGDGNGNGIIQNTDETNVWKMDLGASGYLGGDFDLNSIVQNTDETNFWKVNLGSGMQVGNKTPSGYKSQVPE